MAGISVGGGGRGHPPRGQRAAEAGEIVAQPLPSLRGKLQVTFAILPLWRVQLSHIKFILGVKRLSVLLMPSVTESPEPREAPGHPLTC